MRMHVDQRKERLLEAVRRAGRMRVTDLAEQLGVSVITVRRDVEALAVEGLLERSHGVVLWREPGSRPDADGPRGGPVFGMVLPTTGYYFGDIVRGAQSAVAEVGGRLLLALTDYEPELDVAHVERMIAGGVDGLLLTLGWSAGAPEPHEEAWLAGLPVPVVLVERTVPVGSPAAGLDRIRSADTEGSAMAVRHLAGLGHRRIALFQQPGQHSAQVRTGFEAAVAALDLWRPEGTPGLALQTLDADSPVERLVEAHLTDGVTAVLVHNDEVAISVLSALRLRGVKVPEDLSIIAYDDEVAELAEVPLTAIAPPKRELGRTAVAMLLRRTSEPDDEPSPRQHVDMLPGLRVRDSTGPGPGAEAQ
jgi:DNA-binding LacI/PurR family transcriptional regulator